MGNTQTVPEKNSFYHMKEHYAEDFPVLDQEGFEIVKVKTDELFTSDDEALKRVGARIVEGLAGDNILILQNSSLLQTLIDQAQAEAKVFLSKSEADKKVYKAEEIDWKRAFYSGYSLIHFDNRDNKRDKEWRDVFQIRFSEDGHIPWPSETFKSATQKLYEYQWQICIQVLRAMALTFNLNPTQLFALAVRENPATPSPYASENTNLCLFHYFDKFMSYKTPQRCMVHRDHGLLTLLPKTDLPGLELLHPKLKQWIPIEQYIDNTDTLLYCGEALAQVLDSKVEPATHRVVRLPQMERYSMPFEMKPNNNTVLANLVAPEKEPAPTTFDGLTKRLQWERIMRQVDRADGIPPTDAPRIEEQPAPAAEVKPDFGQAHHDVQLPSISVK